MIYKQIAQLFRGAFRKEKCELVLLAASAELADWAADSKLFSMEGASFIPYKKLFLKFILHIKTIIFELNTYSNLRAKPFRRCIQSFFVVYINLREIYEFINSNVYISVTPVRVIQRHEDNFVRMLEPPLGYWKGALLGRIRLNCTLG